MTESELYENMIICIKGGGDLVCASATRNVRVRFGAEGPWHPFYYTTGILAGSSYIINGSTRFFVYRTDINSDGAFHVLNDNNTTYTPYSLGFGYANCRSTADTQAKVASLSGYKLISGGLIAVRFQYGFNAGDTININNTGAKQIYYKSNPITNRIINAEDTVILSYSGTSYVLVSKDIGNISDYVKKTDALKCTSLSITLAATNWSNGTQTITNTTLTDDCTCIINTSASSTEAQTAAITAAKLSISSNATNTLTFTASGTVPTIDIPISLIIFNKGVE